MKTYLTGHDLPYLKTLSHILQKTLVFVDIESTGLVYEPHFAIIEIGLVIIKHDSVKESSYLINPHRKIPEFITKLTGITDDMVSNAFCFSRFIKVFQTVANNDVLVGFNSRAFDSIGISRNASYFGENFQFLNQIDIRRIFTKNRNELLDIKSQKGNLIDASNFYKVSLDGDAHRAGYDIALTVLLAEKILNTHGIVNFENEIKKFNNISSKENYFNYLSKVNSLSN